MRPKYSFSIPSGIIGHEAEDDVLPHINGDARLVTGSQAPSQPRNSLAELCMTCHDSAIEVLTSPCQHAALCSQCSRTWHDESGICSVCRSPVVSRARLLLYNSVGHRCMTCQIREIQIVNSPCQHAALCAQCSEPWHGVNGICRVCMAPVVSTSRVFLYHSN